MKKVLIVDDTAFMRMSIKTFLTKNGYQEEEIREAENGLEGVNAYKEFMPDIVTMDITMPEMTGVEALKEILKFDPKAKVVMLSALGQESVVREAIIHGAKSFIVKPCTEEQVIKTLNKILGL